MFTGYVFIDNMNITLSYENRYGQKFTDFSFASIARFFERKVRNLRVEKVFIYTAIKVRAYQGPNLTKTEIEKKQNALNGFINSVQKNGNETEVRGIYRRKKPFVPELKWNQRKFRQTGIGWEEKGVDAFLITEAMQFQNNYQVFILCANDTDYKPLMYRLKNTYQKRIILCHLPTKSKDGSLRITSLNSNIFMHQAIQLSKDAWNEGL